MSYLDPQDIYEVDQLFKDMAYSSAHTCIICSNQPAYRIIPKDKQHYTAEIQDRGYICEHCAKSKYIDPAIYGLRPLKRGNTNGTRD